ELVVEPPVAQECKRVAGTPNLLTGLLCAENPIIALLNGAEAINEIARGEATETAMPVPVQEVSAHTAEFVHLHRITWRPRDPLGQPRHAPVLLEHDADGN